MYKRQGYISFYWQGQFYELNLSRFNEIFGFPPSLHVSIRKVPRQFNPNAFWQEIGRTTTIIPLHVCTHIRNPCIQVAQHIIALDIFARDESVNLPRLFEMYFLSCVLQGDRIDPRSHLERQLYSATTSTKKRIVIRGIITSIIRFLGIELNPDDRVRGFQQLDKAAFGLMGFCQVEASRLCWIYPGGHFCLFPT